MSERLQRRLSLERAGFAALALAAGSATFFWALARRRVLLYGDATAHLAIARRIVDSATPGLSQWGTVWLPLPHLLMALTVLLPGWWRTGAAGSVVSLAAFALATWFLHRIVARAWGRAAAAWAAAFFCLNPSLLYLSAVPMTETIYLAAFLGLVDQCSAPASNAAAWRAGMWGLAASLCRYDGWFVLPFAVLALAVAIPGWSQRWSRFWRFSLVAGLGPLFWFAYNQWYFGDWLAFSRGPYSARRIYLDALRHGGAPYPGDHALAVAAVYFLKTVALACGGPLLLLASLGLIAWLVRARRAPAPALLLLPFVWYLWAMWSGNVPIFVPQYWPHGYYNLRYGVQALPAVAAFSGFAAVRISAAARRVDWTHAPRRAPVPPAAGGIPSVPPAAGGTPSEAFSVGGPAKPQRAFGVILGLALLCAAAYLAMLRSPASGVIAYAEAAHNAPYRLAMEADLARGLARRRPGQTVLMYFGTFPGALADDAIPLHDVIQESNFLLWQNALAAPARYADWVVIERHGPVDKLVDRRSLNRDFHRTSAFAETGEPDIEVYERNQSLAGH